MDRCFGKFNFRSIDSIMVCGACRLRKVMTSKQQIPDNTNLWVQKEFGDEVAFEYEQQYGGIDY